MTMNSKNEYIFPIAYLKNNKILCLIIFKKLFMILILKGLKNFSKSYRFIYNILNNQKYKFYTYIPQNESFNMKIISMFKPEFQNIILRIYYDNFKKTRLNKNVKQI